MRGALTAPPPARPTARASGGRVSTSVPPSSVTVARPSAGASSAARAVGVRRRVVRLVLLRRGLGGVGAAAAHDLEHLLRLALLEPRERRHERDDLLDVGVLLHEVRERGDLEAVELGRLAVLLPREVSERPDRERARSRHGAARRREKKARAPRETARRCLGAAARAPTHVRISVTSRCALAKSLSTDRLTHAYVFSSSCARAVARGRGGRGRGGAARASGGGESGGGGRAAPSKPRERRESEPARARAMLLVILLASVEDDGDLGVGATCCPPCLRARRAPGGTRPRDACACAGARARRKHVDAPGPNLSSAQSSSSLSIAHEARKAARDPSAPRARALVCAGLLVCWTNRPPSRSVELRRDGEWSAR